MQSGKQFNSRPQTSTVAHRAPNTQAPAIAPGQVVALVSNQYKLKLGGSVQVF
jgi:aubergine